MVVTSIEMIGLESTVYLDYLPPQKFHISRALSRSTTAIQISGNINYHKLCWFSLVPNRSFLGGTRRKKSLFPAFVSDLSSASPESDQDNARRKSPNVQILLKRFWEVAAPYWFSDDKVAARWRLAGVFALTLGTTGISVGFNFLGRDFYNALANKDQEQFSKQLMYYLAAFATGIPVSTLLHFLRGSMCLILLFLNIFGYKITARLPKDNVAWTISFTFYTLLKVFVLRDYAKDTLSLRWRSWMTSYYMDRYLKNITFYKIQSQSIIDNPDQRIVDDLSSFTATALAFSLTLFNASVDLISFSNILYGIYPPLFLVLLGYSLGGTAISIVLGRGLVNLNFFQEKKEADFRYGLVRIRENAESIAFYGGEQNEMQILMQRFRSAFENLSQLLISSRNLEFFTNGYRYLIQILPAAVVAPMYFSGKIEFGVINQSASAFNHILGDFSLIVYQFQALSAFSAVIERLGEFDDLLNNKDTRSATDNLEEICRELCIISDFSTSNGYVTLANSSKLMSINRLTLMTPSGATLIRDLSLDVYERNHLLVTGPSGSGKTSLLRAVAGLWSFGKGTITSYERNEGDPLSQFTSNKASLEVSSVEETMGHENRRKNERSRGVFFLPQKPYMVLGTLRQQLLYPTWREDSISMSDNDKPTGSLPFLTMAQDMYPSPQKPTAEDIIQVLHDVRLGYILSRFDLDSMSEWSSVLSLGEQQRLAFARLLLSKPTLVLLDESTSALDEANETHIYRLIEAAGITYISIGHRKTLYEYHKQVLRISPVEPTNADPNWHFEPINETSTYYPSKQ